MKDLDFDELDKAVNSLMANTGPATVQSVQASADPAPVEISTTLTPVESNAALAPKVTQQTPPRAITATPQVTSLPTKRSGRFMDVVHPSSDMKTTPSVPQRQGATLTPINRNIIAEDAAPSPQQPSPTPEVPERSSVDEHSWPDPLALHETTETPSSTDVPLVEESDQSTSTPSVEIKEEIQPVSELIKEEKIIAAEPAPSPFLADAKVEKRPLGAAVIDVSNNSEQGGSTESQSSTDGEDADAQGPPPVQLPEELHDDLLAVESDETLTTPKQESVSPAPANQETAGPVSITQQYKIQPSTADTSHAAVYDTVAQPLSHPTKKKSSLLKVVLIIFILALFAGGGAALFFLGYL